MRKLIFLMAGFFFFGVISARANNIYIAQSATGAANGADCADTYAPSFFNSSSNWGTGSNKIGPGTTVHLCGTITAPAGSSGFLTFQGSGTSGSLITLKFETGAVLTAPYWGANGAIYASGKSYVVVDGGTNGTITATANGTNLTNQYTQTRGVYFYAVSNSEIENLTVSNIYVHAASPNDEVGTQDTWGIEWQGGSNVTIDNNKIHDAYGGIWYVIPGSATSSNVNIFHNEAYNCNWSITLGDGNTDAILNTALVYGNKVHDWANWDETANQNHHDGLFVYAASAGSAYNNVQVYNNQSYGNTGVDMTAHIYMSGNGGTGNYVFNNLMYNTGSLAPDDAYLYDYGVGTSVFNNTIVGRTATGSGGSGYMQYGTGSVLANNIISTCYIGIYINNGASISSSDYNSIYNCTTVGRNGSSWYTTMANWQASSGSPDAHSTARNPLLNASSSPPYQLTSTSSPAYRTGTNLTSYCSTVPALCTDYSGKARPSSGAWDMGAHQLADSTSGSAPNPPNGLKAVVN